jgi:hypothetical protein
MAALIPAIIDFVIDRMRKRRGGGGGGGAPAAPAAPPDPSAKYEKMMMEYMMKGYLGGLDNSRDAIRRLTPTGGESRGSVAKPNFTPVMPGLFAPKQR